MPKKTPANETDDERYVRLGIKNIKNKKYQRAYMNLKKAIKVNPKCSQAYLYLGLLARRNRDFEKAFENYNKAIEINPDFAHAYVHRSEIYYRRNKFDDALADLKKAKDSKPSSEISFLINSGTIFLKLRDYQKAKELYEKALEKNPTRTAQSIIFLNLGRAYSCLNQPDKALNSLEKAIEINPKYTYNYIARGIVYDNTKQWEKAREDFEKAVKQDPKNFDAQLNLAIHYRITGKLGYALKTLKYAIELCPQDYNAHFQLANLYEKLQQFDKSLNEYDKVIALRPDYGHPYAHKGLIFSQLCNDEETLKNFSKAVELDKDDDVAHAGLGFCMMNLERFNDALKEFQTAIKIDPSFGWAHLGRGQALCFLLDEKSHFKMKKKHENEMLESFEEAIMSTDLIVKELGRWWKKFSKKYAAASSENKKRLRVIAQIYDDTLENKIFSTISDQKNRLTQFVNSAKNIPATERYLQILRRWNSFTPAIPEKSRSNLGGGYFLACNGEGIVIDPGYNFIENFIDTKLSLGDIDDIVLTHAHDDHTANFEAILSLFSKLKDPKKISLFANLGAFVKFSSLIAKNENRLENIELLNENQIYKLSKFLTMKPTRAEHKDILTEDSAKGLIFESKKASKKIRIGITGDTKFYTGNGKGQNLCSSFENMDVLVLHIGSIHKQEFDYLDDNFEKHRYDGEHLGIRGVVNLIFHCRPKLAIISEFGEELRTIRSQIAARLDNHFENFDSSGNVRVIPGDIGLKISFTSGLRVKCEICEKMVNFKDINYTETLINHKICYHCKKHKRAEIINLFKSQEEEELRSRAENIGCRLDFIFPVHTGYVE